MGSTSQDNGRTAYVVLTNILLGWEQTVAILIDHTVKFPKAMRFTFAQRMDHLALDVLEALSSARFSSRVENNKLFGRPTTVWCGCGLSFV